MRGHPRQGPVGLALAARRLMCVLAAVAAAMSVPVAIVSCRNLAPKASAGRKNPFGGCAQCHVDVVDELAGGKHAAAGVGCIRCHGPSKAHAADENNEVKPDRMPGRDRIDSFCASCHKCTRPTPPLTAPAATPPKPKICTDCHGTHKIKLR